MFDSGWVSHLRGQLELFAFGNFVERLAGRFTVTQYDRPGCGQVHSRAQIAAWVTEHRLRP